MKPKSTPWLQCCCHYCEFKYFAFSHSKYNWDPLDCFCTARKCNFPKGKQNFSPREWLLLGVWTSTLSLNSRITKLILRLICSSFSTDVPLNSQVLFKSPGTDMGHIIQSWSCTKTSTETLGCLLLQHLPKLHCRSVKHCCCSALWLLQRKMQFVFL